TIAIEDQNFYRHIGIDPVAIFRALDHNLRNNTQEGASTITQQLIKNSLLTPEKSYVRKIKEVILALWAERIYSKEAILQMYFNEAPYGGSNMGIAAASQTYFGKSSSELNLAEAAYLAGLPVSPTEFSPYGSRSDLTKLRQKEVLERMVKEKYITREEADNAFAEELNIKPPVNNILAPHFVMFVRDFLSEKYGPRVVSQGGLKIYTTLDLNLQEIVETIVKEEVDKLKPLNVQNGAALVTDTNGQILAMVGSKDYHEPNFGNFNVTTSLRQPGSSIKVITYATAFKKGFSPGNTVLDTPVRFNDGVNIYAPVNYDGVFHGPVSIRTALGSSYNIPAVKMLATVGMDDALKTALDLGITTF
ncbi:MAG: transglycosylase domain-containing protein, partial [Candidatus Daviesbacteria bacterium]|nr:transglycosylase domain-containing protein [Candidatus Daviesbacteria bacterium]